MNGDALSDLLLAIVGLFFAWRLMPQRPGLAIGMGLIGFAAGLGVLRFSGIDAMLGPHRFASLLAGCAGLPLLAASLRWPDDSLATRVNAAAYFAMIIGALGVVLVVVVQFSGWAQLVPAASALLILMTALQQRHAVAILGSTLLIGSFVVSALGLVAGPLNSIQLLHLLMACGLALLTINAPQKHTPNLERP